MSRVVYLHVGAPKTGTTYLQDRLALNRAELARHGIHYPIGLHATHFPPALDLLGASWGGQRENVRGEWDALMSRVRRLSGTVVISHEILAGAKPHQIERARSDLQGSELHVVYSARDLGRQIPAEWQEGVKHRRRRSFATFLKAVQTTPRTNSSLWFWRAQGLPDVLNRWTRGLPPSQVHLVTVPQAGAPRDLLWQRYCRVFGIDPAWAPEDSARANASIGAAEAAIVRKLNSRLRKAGLSSDDYRKLIRDVVVHETLAHRTNMAKVTLPPRALSWACEVAEEWVEWVGKAGIDVVGDVEELRPVPPDATQPWANPDRPRRPDMLDAALDVMTALTIEAARRPDPDTQVLRKFRRAARRLRHR